MIVVVRLGFVCCIIGVLWYVMYYTPSTHDDFIGVLALVALPMLIVYIVVDDFILRPKKRDGNS